MRNLVYYIENEFARINLAAIISPFLSAFSGDKTDATTTRSRTVADSLVVCPASAWARIRIEYSTDTWRTNLDTYARILEDEVKKNAVIVATALYQLAMRDEMPPRSSREALPPPLVAATTLGRSKTGS